MYRKVSVCVLGFIVSISSMHTSWYGPESVATAWYWLADRHDSSISLLTV